MNRKKKWTPERVATLTKMKAAGYSATQIAKALGGTTRNAVLGKAHRMGLCEETTATEGSIDMTFEIEKGVPMPGKRTNNRGYKYPFANMEVGDSLFAEGSYKEGPAKNMLSAAAFFAKSRDVKFSRRAVEGGVRIWRVE